MRKFILIILQLSLFISCISAGQKQIYPSIFSSDSTKIEELAQVSFVPKQFPSYLGKGFLNSAAFNLFMWSSLLAMPQSISKWDPNEKFKLSRIRNQYKLSFSKPPEIDKDLWTINYIGHPYQGSFYYNTVRSQGVKAWESAAFCLGQSLLWEYVWEGGMEQPSVQDLIITPVLGSVLGELSHRAVVRMSKNGYKWHEKIVIIIINPNYAINVGFGRKK